MKALKIIIVTFYLVFLLSSKWVIAQSLEEKIDSILEIKFKSEIPGGAFLVAKGGKAIYRKAFGMANLELNVPLSVESVFEIGSLTKQFTAISILLLAQEGKLSLKDEITRFIPDYPTHGKIITIHHLLTHTSGIKSFTSVKGLNDISKENLSPLELIDFFKNELMDFDPGEQFKYNNSGYIILGHIVEMVSSQSYADYVEENIFQKIGMNTSYYASHTDVIPNRAYGYHEKNIFVNKKYISYSIPYSSGALMSTIDDMLNWQNALKNNELLDQQTIDKVFTNYTLNNGDQINYGYGWHLKEIEGYPSWEHGGHIFGFKSMSVYIPEEDIYVIGLTNCDCNSPTQIVRHIAKIVVENF